jgi:DNA invertase Pin-like site-specific DNA recombinase
MRERIDTTTNTGKLLFGIIGSLAEFERATIRQRVKAGLAVIEEKIERCDRFTSKAGVVRTRLGRPGAKPEAIEEARVHLAAGRGIRWTAGATKLGVGTVQLLKREMELAPKAKRLQAEGKGIAEIAVDLGLGRTSVRRALAGSPCLGPNSTSTAREAPNTPRPASDKTIHPLPWI